MAELLILKSEKDYFRFQEEGFFTCTLQKASVFPMNALAEVRSRLNQLQDQGYPGAAIFTLTITETPFEEYAAKADLNRS